MSAMSGMSDFKRLLSRRERRSTPLDALPGSKKPQPRNAPSQFYGVFAVDDSKKKPDKEEEKKAKALVKRFNNHEITHISEAQAEFALRTKYTNGDVEKAEDLLNLFQRSWEGLIVEPKASEKLVGAENREKVTCYLDALLFSMFARLHAFQPILYMNFDDEPRKKLSGLLRLWVNMLRSGILITTDITKRLQDALSDCGWSEATNLHQQDASEAFTFITDKLQLPLLTLKMDIFHHGKEEAQDDHKFVNERLLNVAIPSEADPNGTITLEECLEHYFNNRIEVKRYLQRRNTMHSSKSVEAGESSKLHQAMHIETKEVVPESPAAVTPTTPTTPLRPVSSRNRADSIFSQSTVDHDAPEQTSSSEGQPSRSLHRRQSSMRTEVNMPAWQFFSLIPWYTDNAPKSDAQVAAHFSQQRPMLGICLKRYGYTAQGSTIKLGTHVVIPQEIAIPPFVSDDALEEHGPVFGNFKLVLQSAVCHRGSSPDSGHYVSLVRGRALNATSYDSDSAESTPTENACEWMLFDDLAKERIRYVDIDQALDDETPYLLFYQVLPIDMDPNRANPPTYAEATENWSDRHYNDVKDAALFETNRELESVDESVQMEGTDAGPTSPENDNCEGRPKIIQRPNRISLDIPSSPFRGRSSMSDTNRSSGMLDDSSVTTDEPTPSLPTVRTAPTTPMDDMRSGWLGGSRRGSKTSSSGNAIPNGSIGKKAGSKSRPSSSDKDSKRLAATVSKLTARMSRDRLKEQAPEGEGTRQDTHATTEEVASNTEARLKSKPRTHGTLKSKHRPRHSGADGKSGELDDQKCILM